MNGMVRWSAQTPRRASRREWRAGMAGAFGGLVMILALTFALAVAVVFAATLAVVMLLMTVLTALSALAWRMRPRPAPQPSVVMQPQAGHAWIAYASDRAPS